jgi:hypothetical protein
MHLEFFQLFYLMNRKTNEHHKDLMLKFDLIIPISGGGYLVPSLLPINTSVPKETLLSLHRPTEFTYRFSFPFFPKSKPSALNFSLNELGSQSGLSLDDLQASSFLPHSLFIRFLSKAISWAQETGSDITANLKNFFQNASFLSYGNLLFQIVPNHWLGVLQIDVRGGNPISIHDRLKDQIQNILSDYFPNLEMLTTISVQFPSGEWRFFTLDCIKETISKKSKLFIDSVNEIGFNELVEKFGIWVANTEARRWYDVFLSDRWAKGEGELVKGIFDSLTRYSLGEDSRLIHTFHDVSRLKDGQPLHESFSTGLINSSLVVSLFPRTP